MAMKRTVPRRAAVSAAVVLLSLHAGGVLATGRAHATPAAARHSLPRYAPGCVEGVCAAVAPGVQGAPTDGDSTPPSAAPALASHVMPIYPPIARSALVQGVVLVDVGIGIDGRVTDARILRSIALLDDAALDAVRQWRFVASQDTSTKITVTVRFVLDDPSVYPRPATYRHDLPFWIPGNFAFVYEYGCRRATVEINSITRVVTNTRDRRAPAQQFSFDFQGEQAAGVFVLFVGAGLFEAVREGRTWKEVPPAEPGIGRTGDQILVTVAAQRPVLDVQNAAQIQWSGGDQPARSFRHVLRVRRADQWKEFRWQDPPDAKHSENEKALAAAGRRIRTLVKNNLTDTRMRPICL